MKESLGMHYTCRHLSCFRVTLEREQGSLQGDKHVGVLYLAGTYDFEGTVKILTKRLLKKRTQYMFGPAGQ